MALSPDIWDLNLRMMILSLGSNLIPWFAHWMEEYFWPKEMLFSLLV